MRCEHYSSVMDQMLWKLRNCWSTAFTGNVHHSRSQVNRRIPNTRLKGLLSDLHCRSGLWSFKGFRNRCWGWIGWRDLERWMQAFVTRWQCRVGNPNARRLSTELREIRWLCLRWANCDEVERSSSVANLPTDSWDIVTRVLRIGNAVVDEPKAWSWHPCCTVESISASFFRGNWWAPWIAFSTPHGTLVIEAEEWQALKNLHGADLRRNVHLLKVGSNNIESRLSEESDYYVFLEGSVDAVAVFSWVIVSSSLQVDLEFALGKNNRENCFVGLHWECMLVVWCWLGRKFIAATVEMKMGDLAELEEHQNYEQTCDEHVFFSKLLALRGPSS